MALAWKLGTDHERYSRILRIVKPTPQRLFRDDPGIPVFKYDVLPSL